MPEEEKNSRDLSAAPLLRMHTYETQFPSTREVHAKKFDGNEKKRIRFEVSMYSQCIQHLRNEKKKKKKDADAFFNSLF